MSNKVATNKKGFTLIEVLLYITIAGTILSVFSFFLYIMLSMQVKSQVISEVEQQGIQVMQEITQATKDAQGINSPTDGTASSLSLDVISSVKDPTIFSLSSGVIRISEGGGIEINLTSGRIVASDFIVNNLSKAGTPGTIRIEFTLTHVNPEGRNEYNYSKKFYGSASIR
ncbi:MAG: prepilin-type N-terminal cleavage/methylation domain-containing protein [Candidatus Moraniibacteriota bacterium]